MKHLMIVAVQTGGNGSRCLAVVEVKIGEEMSSRLLRFSLIEKRFWGSMLPNPLVSVFFFQSIPMTVQCFTLVFSVDLYLLKLYVY